MFLRIKAARLKHYIMRYKFQLTLALLYLFNRFQPAIEAIIYRAGQMTSEEI